MLHQYSFFRALLDDCDIFHITALLKQGINPNAHFDLQYNWTLFFEVISRCNKQPRLRSCVAAMIAHGADVNDHADLNSACPLSIAIRNKDYQTACILLAAGANANHIMSEGNILLYSVSIGDISIIEIILQCGGYKYIDVASGFSTFTPLCSAIWNARPDIVEILLRYGSDPDAFYEHNYTARNLLDDTISQTNITVTDREKLALIRAMIA